MKNSHLLTTVILFISFLAFSQRDKPTEEDLQYAKSLKEKYEDEDVVISNYTINISFERNSRTNKVEVIENKSITFLAISQRADLVYSTGYNNETEVEELELYDRRDKKVAWGFKDEAYSDASIFHNDYRLKYGEINLPLQGYKRRIQEVKRYKDIKYFTVEYLKNPYRTMNGKIRINIPDWLNFSTKDFHFSDHDIDKSENMDGKSKVLVYTFKNMPAIKKESYMPGSSFIHPHIVYLPKSYTDKDNTEQTLFNTTKDLYAWYKKLVDEVEIETEELEAKVKDLTEGLTKDEEKIKAIYYWVQDNIKYIAFEDGIAGFKPDSPQNVYSKKYGDCKGMAILLKTMLKEAGYDARLVWIGTDAIAYDYSLPSLIVDNHMIAAVILDSETIFLDGTEKFNAFGTFASRIQGKQALIENGEDFILKEVPRTTPVNNKEVYSGDINIIENNLEGEILRKLSGEQVSHFLYGFTGVPTDKREEIMLKVLTDGNNNAKVYDVDGFDPTKRDTEINLSYKLKLENVISAFDNNLYLELDPVRYMSNFKIPEDRENPFQLRMKRQELKNLNLIIPSNYQVESLPKPVNIDNDFMKVEAAYNIKEGKVTYDSNIIIKKRYVSKDNFELWNSSIDQLKNFYDEQIVLVKK
jgi:hypothetical protein